MRLIDADAVLKQIDEMLKLYRGKDIEEWLANQIHIAVHEAPTIEPSNTSTESTNTSTDTSTDTDLISREDAIEALEKLREEPEQYYTQYNAGVDCSIKALSALPTVDRPTVIRSRTLMPTKDFKEWAKRIKEENPNVIVIPCDAEVESAEAVHKPDYSYEADMVKRLRQAEVVHGEWVDVENEPYCECSVCGSYIDNLDDDYAFCPRCGARMEAEE